MHPYLEGETLNLSVTGTQVRTSTNNCFGGGAPGGATQYDAPISTNVFSRSRTTLETRTRRSGDNALFARWYNRGWKGTPTKHAIVGQPAVAVFEGELHVIARKSDGTIFDLLYNPSAGWKTTYLSGVVAGDPDVAMYGWGKSLRVAARGTDGYLYQWWTTANGSWPSPVRVGNVGVVGAPALFSHYDTFYIVARASDNSLWSWEWDRRGRWMEWQLLGAANDNPDIGVDPRSGLVNVVARGTDSRIYRWQSKDPDWDASHPTDGWNHPELVDASHLVTGAPATTIQRGTMHIIARGSNNAVHHWWKDTTWHREATGGTFSSDPDVVPFGHQLQIIGATDDALALAIEQSADHVTVVPCCQAEVARQLEAARPADPAIAALFAHPLHRRELGSHLTNVVRGLALEAHGYKVTVTELVGWEHSAKNELILGKRGASLQRLGAGAAVRAARAVPDRAGDRPGAGRPRPRSSRRSGVSHRRSDPAGGRSARRPPFDDLAELFLRGLDENDRGYRKR